jgi:hypothetical protein
MKKAYLVVLAASLFACGKKDDDNKTEPSREFDCYHLGLTFDKASNACGKSATYGLISNDKSLIACKGYSDIRNYGAYCSVKQGEILGKQDSEKTITIKYNLIAEPSTETQDPKTSDPAEFGRVPRLIFSSETDGIERSLKPSDFADHKPIPNTLTLKGTGPVKLEDLNTPVYTKGYWLTPDATLEILDIRVE